VVLTAAAYVLMQEMRLHLASLSGTATKEEMELLRNLRFNGKRPTSIYYYPELQSLRDPLHFREA
jgi:hypothetical protein